MSYLIASLAWGIIGFVAGYVLGRVTTEVHEIKEAVVEHDGPEPEPVQDSIDRVKKLDPDIQAGINRTNRLGWVIILLAVLFVGTGVYQQLQANDARQRREEALQCLGAWAVDFGAALDARTQRSAQNSQARTAWEDSTAAVIDAIAPVLTPGNDKMDVEELRERLDTHHEAWEKLRELSAEQADTVASYPYPEPPDACIIENQS